MEAGTRVAGKYRLEAVLGEGGCGVVWRARHLDLDEDVALKLIHPHLADGPAQERFLREVRATKAVVHRFAVPLRDFGRDPELGVLYFTMDLVPGRTLKDALAQGHLPPGRAVRLTCQILRALEEAHAAGLIHRDIKPANVMLTVGRDGTEEVRLLDFGIAKAIDASQSGGFRTQTGLTVGTLEYMSPEQADGAAVDARSDQYAVAVVLYEALSGARPIAAQKGSRASFIVRLLTAPPRPLIEVAPDVPPDLAGVVMRALSKAPEDRYVDAAAFRAALEAVPLKDEPEFAETFVPPTATPRAADSPAQPDPTAPPRRSRRLLFAGFGIAVCGAIGLAALKTSDPTVAVTSATPSPTSEPTRPAPRSTTPPTARPTARPTTRPTPSSSPTPTRVAPAPPRPAVVPRGLSEVPDEPGVFVNAKDGSQLVWVPTSKGEGFFLGRFEVTWAQYRRFCRETARTPPTNEIALEKVFTAAESHPVFNVSHADATAYCTWAKLELPSAADWRHAARVGAENATTPTYPWGSKELDATRANFQRNDPFPITAPVSSLPAGRSPDGCHHLVGNVEEWLLSGRTAGGSWNSSAALSGQTRRREGFEYGPETGFRVRSAR